MLEFLFRSRYRAQRDTSELQSMQANYGPKMLTVLQKRADDNALRERDRKHWKRLWRKAKRRAA